MCSNEVTVETLSELENIQSTCDIFQREPDSPYRFRVSSPLSDVFFNRIVHLSLMKLKNKPVLHPVHPDTKFSGVIFLDRETTLHMWEALMRILVITFIRYPDTLAVDRGPQFTTNEWSSLTHNTGTEVHSSGVEGHNAIGAGEKYNSFLPRFSKTCKRACRGFRTNCLLQLR